MLLSTLTYALSPTLLDNVQHITHHTSHITHYFNRYERPRRALSTTHAAIGSLLVAVDATYSYVDNEVYPPPSIRSSRGEKGREKEKESGFNLNPNTTAGSGGGIERERPGKLDKRESSYYGDKTDAGEGNYPFPHGSGNNKYSSRRERLSSTTAAPAAKDRDSKDRAKDREQTSATANTGVNVRDFMTLYFTQTTLSLDASHPDKKVYVLVWIELIDLCHDYHIISRALIEWCIGEPISVFFYRILQYH